MLLELEDEKKVILQEHYKLNIEDTKPILLKQYILKYINKITVPIANQRAT